MLDDRTGALYLCTYEKTIFLNKNGQAIKNEVKLLNYKFIKTMEIADFKKDVTDAVDEGYKLTGNFMIPSFLLVGAGVATTFFCPPLGLLLEAGGSVGSVYSGIGPMAGLLSGGARFIRNLFNVKEAIENKYKICYNLEYKEKDNYR